MDRKTLYRDYMTVVFGLVATKGLEQLAEKALHGELHWPQVPFFLGAFIVGIHYWYICVDYARASEKTYTTLSNLSTKRFAKNLLTMTFFGVPVLFVTAYAGAVVVFFYSIPGHYDLLFRAFGIFLLASSINDVWDFLTTLGARQATSENERNVFTKELIRTAIWFGCDYAYFLVFALSLNDRLVLLSASRPGAAGMDFLGLVALGVILDAAVTDIA